MNTHVRQCNVPRAYQVNFIYFGFIYKYILGCIAAIEETQDLSSYEEGSQYFYAGSVILIQCKHNNYSIVRNARAYL